MIIDGISLTEGSGVQNFSIDSGASFPIDASLGELFYLTSGTPGMYCYAGSSWEKVSFGDFVVPYDVVTFCSGKPQVNEKLISFKTPTAFVIPANFDGSFASAGVNGTGTSVFSIKKNGTQVSTITFSVAGGATGVFSNVAEVSFASGDVISLEAPAVQDATLADIMFTFKGNAA